METNKAGNFVCAALPSIWTHVTNTIKDHPEYLSDESVNCFFKNNVDKFLTSIGVVIPRLPKDPNKRRQILKRGRMTPELIKKYVTFLEKFNQSDFLKDTERIIDSAAYSMQIGYFDRAEIPQFIDLYYREFLEKQPSNYNYAFLLDIASGSIDCPFNSFEDLSALADESYKTALSLSDDIRKKLIYVHHFRTPSTNNIYKNLLNKYGEGFSNFGTGGLVSFSRTGKIPPYIMYAVPLAHIINHARNRNLKKFRFHVLGGSEWKEILGHKFFERHVKELFDIDLQITFDSSTLFKTLCLGRYTFQVDHEQKKISKLTLRSKFKNNYVGIPGSDRYNNKTNEEVFCDLVNEAIVSSGMKPLSLKDVNLYDGLDVDETEELSGFTNEHLSSSGVLSRLSYTYGMFQLLRLFKIAEDWCNEMVDTMYEKFMSKHSLDVMKTNEVIDKFMIMLNGGETFSDNLLKYRSLAIHNSLDLLAELKTNPKSTLEKCDWIIEEFMSRDEHEKLRSPLTKENPMPGFEEF